MKYKFPPLPENFDEEQYRDWFKQACAYLADMVGDKRAAYGDNLIVSGDFLRIFFPDGIPPEAYEEALVIVRLGDKLMRVANKHRGLNKNEEESPWLDVCGYGLAIEYDLRRMERRKNAKG